MRSLLACLALGLTPVTFAHEALPAGACHTGAYTLSDGSSLVVQPSDADNLRYRFLDGVSGRLYPIRPGEYESGTGWAVREPVSLRVTFGTCESETIQFERQGHPSLKGRKMRLRLAPISFASADAMLYGELVMPERSKPLAVVVLQYGSGQDSAVVHNYVQHLLPLKDIAVFVFDKRGTGRSTGRFSAHVGALSDDMVAAVRAVRAHPAVKGLPLGVMGESQGGWVAPLAASKTPVDFVVVSYGLAVSMQEEDRTEIANALRAKGYGPDVLAKGDEINRVTTRVCDSQFRDGLEELERLKAAYAHEPWFEDLDGDYTSVLMSTPKEEMPKLQAAFNVAYDLTYDPLPVIRNLSMPQLWILGDADTEAPHEATLARLQQVKAAGTPIEIVVFPNAEHGIIAVEQGPDGRRLAGRTAAGYFELLGDWITARAAAVSGVRREGANARTQ